MLSHKIKTVTCSVSGTYGRFTVSGEYAYDINRGIVSARISLMTDTFGSLVAVSDSRREFSVPPGENMAEVASAASEIFDLIENRGSSVTNLNL